MVAVRGGWQGSGTWWTSGPDPRLIGVVLVVVAATSVAEWISARIWWLLTATTVVIALAVTGIVWLARWTRRREAEWGAQRTAAASAHRDEIPQAPPRPELGQRILHLHFHGPADAEQADLIRRAISPQSPVTGPMSDDQ